MRNDAFSSETVASLISIATRCAEIRKALRLGTISLQPLNFEKEKIKFFESHKYNPQFTYDNRPGTDFNIILTELHMEIEELMLPKDLKEHLVNYIHDLKLLNNLKRSVGDEVFSDYAFDLFGIEIEQIQQQAVKIDKIKLNESEKGKLLGAEEIMNIFQDIIIKKYSIYDYVIGLEQNAGSIINVGYDHITLGDSIKRYERNINRLVVHEIESHVLQNQNIKRAHTPLAKLTRYANENLYSEGLAVYNEIKTMTITEEALNSFMLRFEAVRAIKLSFRDLFEMLCENTTKKQAFNIAYRVKRGLRDTSKPGGFPKDAVYYLGYMKVKKYLDTGGDIEMLYRTKSPILSDLLIKYDLLPRNNIILPQFWKKKEKI